MLQPFRAILKFEIKFVPTKECNVIKLCVMYVAIILETFLNSLNFN